MSKIIYKKGNLFNGGELFIAHGVNCQHVMASGFAKELRRLYPGAYETYMNSEMELGTINSYKSSNGVTIFNLLTQKYYGKDGKKYISYNALTHCIRLINNFLWVNSDENKPEVAMPMIGSGLGGGSWDMISAIIEVESTEFQPVVYTL